MGDGWKFPIKLGAALLKHYATKAVGEQALDLVVEQALDAGKDTAIAGIDEWLKSSKARKELKAALERATAEFQQSERGRALAAAGFTWLDSPDVNRAIDSLARSANERELHAAVIEAISISLPASFPQAALNAAAEEFLRCLRQNLLPLKDVGPAVVSQAVLRMEDELASLHRTAREMQLSLKRTEESLSRFITEWQNGAELSLQRAFIDYSAYIADKTRGFVGRQFVFDALDQFLQAESCGYFIVRGDPGIGKSAVMAQVVKERQYAHHFNIAAEGISTPRQFFLNACAQLIARYRLQYMSLPTDAGQDNNFFKNVLLAASKKSPPVVLVVDALDEAEGAPPGARRTNPLQLPPSLPEGVYVIVSTRRTDNALELECDTCQVLELEADSEGNLRDIVEYVDRYARRPTMTALLREWGVSHKEFVRTLQDKSEGNFMYLRHVLPAIERGRLRDANLRELPRGLIGYYQSHWEKMRGEDVRTFVRARQKIIACLATAHQPVTQRFIAKVTRVSPAEVQWTVEQWHEFLHELPGDEGTRFRIYHASYRDFLATKVAG